MIDNATFILIYVVDSFATCLIRLIHLIRTAPEGKPVIRLSVIVSRSATIVYNKIVEIRAGKRALLHLRRHVLPTQPTLLAHLLILHMTHDLIVTSLMI